MLSSVNVKFTHSSIEPTFITASIQHLDKHSRLVCMLLRTVKSKMPCSNPTPDQLTESTGTCTLGEMELESNCGRTQKP